MYKKKIFVDADACPVKFEIIKAAERYNIEVIMVCNGGIRPSKNNLVKIIIVNNGPDEADKWIYDNIEEKDIVVTSDIPLAAKCIEKNSLVLTHNGKILSKDNIGSILATRDLMKDIRSANPFFIDKGKSFSSRDKNNFQNTLDLLIKNK